MSLKLFHYSEEPNIPCFEPRPNKKVAGEMVWAVDEAHAVNLMLPRDCPRVTFATNATSTPADIDRLMGYTTARRVIVVESGWLARICACKLYEYAMPADSFELEDIHAGYYISRTTVIPSHKRAIGDVMGELARRNVELRITPSLWPLRDAVAGSTLEFSISRMRNAQPPINGYVPKFPV
jgi:hypothetical protein